MTYTLHTKQAPGYVTDDGRQIDEHELYTCTDEHGDGPGIWYSSEDHAARSFDRWNEPVTRARREARKAESARLAAAAREFTDNPFARFDA